MVGLFHGKSQSKMDDDWGYPYDLGNLQMTKLGGVELAQNWTRMGMEKWDDG